MGNIKKIIAPKTVGERLRAIRQKLHLEQKAFSDLMGISSPYMSAFEYDHHLPGVEFILKLVSDFDVNPNYLLLGIGSMFIKETESSRGRVQEYAVNVEEVKRFLYFFERSTIIQFRTLSTFRSLMLSEPENIEKELAELEEPYK